MNAEVVTMKDRRNCHRCGDLDALFDRVRRIELILAFLAGVITLGGGSIGLKIFGAL